MKTDNSKCEKCTAISKISHAFSCSHCLCSRCIIQVIFDNYFTQVSCQDEITVQCSCFRGQLVMTHRNLQEMFALFNPEDANDPNIFSFCEKIEHMKEIFKNNLQSTLEMTIQKFDLFIQQLEQSKELYISQMKKTIERADVVISLIKCIYPEKLQKMKSEHLQDRTLIIPSISSIKLKDESEKHIKRFEAKINSFTPYFYTMSQNIDITWRSLQISWINSQTLSKHSHYVRALLQLRDGRLASGSDDRTIQIWQPDKTEFRRDVTLGEHGDYISCIIQLQDGRIASGSGDQTIKIWEETNSRFKSTQTLKGHCDYIHTLIELFSGQIASGGGDAKIIIWEKDENGEFQHKKQLTEHDSPVLALLQLKDGRIVSAGNSIFIWEYRDLNFVKVHSLTDHTFPVRSVLELNDGRLASGSDDLTIIIRDIRYLPKVTSLTLIGHKSFVWSLIQLKDKGLASVSYDKTIKIWEECLDGFKNTQTLIGHKLPVTSIIQLKDGRIATGSCDNSIKIWEEESQ